MTELKEQLSALETSVSNLEAHARIDKYTLDAFRQLAELMPLVWRERRI